MKRSAVLKEHAINLVVAALIVGLIVVMRGSLPGAGLRAPETRLPPTSPPTTSTPVNTQTPTTFPETLTSTPTLTPWPTIPPTITPTPIPTLPSAWVQSPEGGAYLREEPMGRILIVAENGMTVKVLPEIREEAGVVWAHVLLQLPPGGHGPTWSVAGWMAQSLLAFSEPEAVRVASATPTSLPADWGIVHSEYGPGAWLRTEPGGDGLLLLSNGTRVGLLMQDTREFNGMAWVHAVAPDGADGWMAGVLIQPLRLTPSPSPPPDFEGGDLSD